MYRIKPNRILLLLLSIFSTLHSQSLATPPLPSQHLELANPTNSRNLVAKVMKMCEMVPYPKDCESPYKFPDVYTTEEDVTPFNVFMRMVRDIQTTIWISEAIWTGLRKASQDKLAAVENDSDGSAAEAERERVRVRAVSACKDLYASAGTGMDDINEYNYGIDNDRTRQHSEAEYAEAAEKIASDLMEATSLVTERCNRAVRNAYGAEGMREAAFVEARERNDEIKRKYANCKAMAEYIAEHGRV